MITHGIWMLSAICCVLWMTEEDENILWRIQACQSVTSRKSLSLESGLILDCAQKTTLSLEVLLCHPWNLQSIRLNTSYKRRKKQFVDIFSIYVLIWIPMKKCEIITFHASISSRSNDQVWLIFWWGYAKEPQVPVAKNCLSISHP